MASSSSSSSSATEESYSKMSVGDVEAIGAHCQMPFCHQLDFLPFKCESCKGKYCLDHRTEDAHSCPQKGAWARQRLLASQKAGQSNNIPVSARPSNPSTPQQCALPACKTPINTPRSTGVHCDTCRRSYCLKHRLTEDHSCSKLIPLGARPAASGPTQKEKGVAALAKLKAWGAAKKQAAGAAVPQSKTKQAEAARIQETANLKRTAKGDDKLAAEKRVYLYVEASSDTVKSKIPKGNFFYSADMSVGRVLDLAAKSLQVQNVNNRVEGEDERLRVFHIEGGRLLEFGEKLGQAVQSGNTIVLLRGVGAGMAKTPEKMGA